MKRLGQKRIQFKKVIIPGTVNLKKLMAEPRVKELAKSFQEDSGGRPLQPPTLDAATYRLVAGADRFAACKLNGDQSTIFELVEGTEKELRRMSIVENLRRRNDDQAKLAKQLVDEIENEIEDERNEGLPEDDDDRGVGRPTAKRAEAIRRAATEANKSEAAIKKAVQRQEQRERRSELRGHVSPKLPPALNGDEPPEPAKLPAPPPPIRILGLEVPQAIVERAEKEQALVDKMGTLLSEIKRTFTEYEKLTGVEQFGKRGHVSSALRAALNEFDEIRSKRPASVCPYCKLLDELQPTCSACRGAGFIGEAELERVERCLLADGDDAGVWVKGKWRTLASMRGDDF